MLLELHVRPEGGHDYRPAIAVVAGINDVLNAGSQIDSAPDVCRVIRFEDVLPPVVQPSVAKKEAVTAVRQIELVIFLNPVRYEGDASTV